jgi:hypothetical protein
MQSSYDTSLGLGFAVFWLTDCGVQVLPDTSVEVAKAKKAAVIKDIFINATSG